MNNKNRNKADILLKVFTFFIVTLYIIVTGVVIFYLLSNQTKIFISIMSTSFVAIAAGGVLTIVFLSVRSAIKNSESYQLSSRRPGGFTDSLFCPSCNSVNPKSANYCGECGNKLVRTCPYCNEENYLNAIHCANCGMKLPK